MFFNFHTLGFWATVCNTPYAIRPLSVCPVLSVTFVHCGQTVGRIKMKLGILGPGHIVLDGDPALVTVVLEVMFLI